MGTIRDDPTQSLLGVRGDLYKFIEHNQDQDQISCYGNRLHNSSSQLLPRYHGQQCQWRPETGKDPGDIGVLQIPKKSQDPLSVYTKKPRMRSSAAHVPRR